MNNTVTGTISFAGQIVGSSMEVGGLDIGLRSLRSDGITVTIKGSETNNAAVQLATVSEHALASPGVTASATQFVISAAGISEKNTHALVFFEAGVTVEPSTGRLINMATAGNVQIQLHNANYEVVRVGDNSQLVSSAFVPVINGEVRIPFIANYYSTGRATPGDVVTAVDYTLFLFDLPA